MSEEEEVFETPAEFPTIARIAVKVPPFWKANPKLWFSQMESQFINAGISQDATKYHTLVGAIESNILNVVSHIIENPPAENMYDALKTALLAEFQESEEKRLQKLLENVSIGDKRPSAMLREMRQLSSGKVSDDMLKSLWFQRLPSTIKAVLSVSSDSLDNIAVMADKINEQLGNSSICPITTSQSSSNSRFENLEIQMAEILNRIEGLSFPQQRSRSRSRNRVRTNPNRESREKSEAGHMCWYHYKFGDRAYKCKSPCAFRAENH